MLKLSVLALAIAALSCLPSRAAGGEGGRGYQWQRLGSEHFPAQVVAIAFPGAVRLQKGSGLLRVGAWSVAFAASAPTAEMQVVSASANVKRISVYGLACSNAVEGIKTCELRLITYKDGQCKVHLTGSSTDGFWVDCPLDLILGR